MRNADYALPISSTVTCPTNAASGSQCCSGARSVRNPEHRFSLVFGEGALRPEVATAEAGVTAR